MLVSVIITCYNDANYISKCINSVFLQTHDQKEIIVIDDGSDVKTKKILNKLSNKIDILISQKNKGQSSARNEGIKVASGNIICIIDSDDTVEKTFIEDCLIFLEDDNRIVGSWLNLKDEQNNTKLIFKPKGGEIEDFLFKNAISGAGIMYYKKDAIKIGGYDESMKSGWEDWDFNLRLMKLGGKAYVVKSPLYNYLKRKNSTTSKANKNKYELLKFMYLKHEKLYVENFSQFVNHVYLNYTKEHNKYLNLLNSLDYKIGTKLLKPIRMVKQFLQW